MHERIDHTVGDLARMAGLKVLLGSSTEKSGKTCALENTNYVIARAPGHDCAIVHLGAGGGKVKTVPKGIADLSLACLARIMPRRHLQTERQPQ